MTVYGPVATLTAAFTLWSLKIMRHPLFQLLVRLLSFDSNGHLFFFLTFVLFFLYVFSISELKLVDAFFENGSFTSFIMQKTPVIRFSLQFHLTIY